jgi:hypothetical protein
MQIGRETLELAYRFQISIRTHRHIMGSVTYVNPSGLRVNHVQPRVVGLQPSCPFLLLFASMPPPVCSHSGSPSWENGIWFGPVTIRLRNLSIGVNERLSSRRALATISVIASTGAMLLCGRKKHQWEVGLSLPKPDP